MLQQHFLKTPKLFFHFRALNNSELCPNELTKQLHMSENCLAKRKESESQPERRILQLLTSLALALALAVFAVGSRTRSAHKELGSHQLSLRGNLLVLRGVHFCWQHCDGAIEVSLSFKKHSKHKHRRFGEPAESTSFLSRRSVNNFVR